MHQQVNHQMAVCVAQASHQPSALNFHSQMSCRHRTKQAELIAAPFRRASTLFGFLMSSLKTQFITHNPFSTLLEMQELGRGGAAGDSSVPFTLGMSLSLFLSLSSGPYSRDFHINTLLIPVNAGIRWEGNAGERTEALCADALGDGCVRKGCVWCKVPEFLITRGQSHSSGHLS